MNTFFYLDVSWEYFCITFGAMLLIYFIMSLLSKNFYTLHVYVRKFSMIDLESPASSLELATFLKGIFKLPVDLAQKSLRSLKGHLFLNFIFMPLIYGSIFLLCMKISIKLTSFGHYFFAILAWAQIIPWICDIIENIYLLQKIRPDSEASTSSVHKAYQIIEIGKWGIALIAMVFSITAMFYFWLTGRYAYDSIQYLLIILAEIIFILILKKLTAKSGKVNLADYQNIGN